MTHTTIYMSYTTLMTPFWRGEDIQMLIKYFPSGNIKTT